MEATIISSDTIEGLLHGRDGITEKLREGWRLYGTVFIVPKSMCEELPEGVEKKGRRICFMMVRNVGDGIN